MRWTELIMLRTTSDAGQDVLQLFEEILPFRQESGLIDVILFNNLELSGDFALAILWETEKPQSGGSDVAMSVVRGLKRFGLVDHSVWKRIPTIERLRKVRRSWSALERKEKT